MSDIYVFGAGEYGTSLAIKLADLGHNVVLFGRDMAKVQDMQDQRCNDIKEWLEDYIFPGNMEIDHISGVNNYPAPSFAILAMPFGNLRSAVSDLPSDWTYVTVQKGVDEKGLTPTEVVRQIHPQCIAMSFTGALFGENLLSGKTFTEMIIAHDNQDQKAKEFALLWKDCESIWPVFSRDPAGVGALNAMRTASSLVKGIVCGYLQGYKPETFVTVYRKIDREFVDLARCLLAIEEDILERGSEVYEAVMADSDLTTNMFCPVEYVQSRNFNYGFLRGRGISHQEAIEAISSTIEGIPNIENALGLITKHADWKRVYPYLHYTHQFLHNKMTLQECLKAMLERRKYRISYEL